MTIRSLDSHKNYSNKPTILSGFEAEAQSILRQINMRNNRYENNKNQQSEQNWYFSRRISHPTSLSQIPSTINDYHQQQNIFGTYNIQTWKQQLKQAEEQFNQNLNTQISNNDAYLQVLGRCKLKLDNLQQAQKLVRNFLKQRANIYSSHTIKIVNEINRILLRNFGLNLTKVQSPNTKQIGMDQFFKMLSYYRVNGDLPSNYKAMLISSSQLNSYQYKSFQMGINLKNHQNNKLENDLQQLLKYKSAIQPMFYYPSQRFNSFLMVYLLKQQFSNQIIQINSKCDRISINDRNRHNSGFDIFKSSNAINRQKIVYSFMVQYDFWISISTMPEFRTKNCLKISLVFLLLLLLKRQKNYNSNLLKSLQKMTNL